jgi:uncharacterized protein (TIGR03118 family)
MVNTISSSATVQPNTARRGLFWLFLSFLLLGLGCAKDETLHSEQAATGRDQDDKIRAHYQVTNLVSNNANYGANIIDPNLVNAWGIAISSFGSVWVSAAGTELSTVYNEAGQTLLPPVTMDGRPTGQVFNSTTGFVIPGVGVSRFIFVTLDGTITAWRTGTLAQTVSDRSAMGAVYTGVELVGNRLYATNVAGGTVDVFDQNWNFLTSSTFQDPSLPAGASPFNIRMIDGQLYVTYVGPDGGYVNVFTTAGAFVKRFASGGTLDEPWGITKTPPEFGLGQAILVGNFGDGRINVYNKNGQFKGQLGDVDGNVIAIDGLWALTFTAGAFAGTSALNLYFAAGPAGETDGLYGKIEFVEE